MYTSQKIKDTQIIKNNSITSSFSIGKDNIMNFSFDLGSISTSELDDILDSVKNKKKYFKLKSGDLINIENDDNLKELENFMDTMNMDSSDIENRWNANDFFDCSIIQNGNFCNISKGIAFFIIL